MTAELITVIASSLTAIVGGVVGGSADDATEIMTISKSNSPA